MPSPVLRDGLLRDSVEELRLAIKKKETTVRSEAAKIGMIFMPLWRKEPSPRLPIEKLARPEENAIGC